MESNITENSFGEKKQAYANYIRKRLIVTQGLHYNKLKNIPDNELLEGYRHNENEEELYSEHDETYAITEGTTPEEIYKLIESVMKCPDCGGPMTEHNENNNHGASKSEKDCAKKLEDLHDKIFHIYRLNMEHDILDSDEETLIDEYKDRIVDLQDNLTELSYLDKDRIETRKKEVEEITKELSEIESVVENMIDGYDIDLPKSSGSLTEQEIYEQYYTKMVKVDTTPDNDYLKNIVSNMTNIFGNDWIEKLAKILNENKISKDIYMSFYKSKNQEEFDKWLESAKSISGKLHSPVGFKEVKKTLNNPSFTNFREQMMYYVRFEEAYSPTGFKHFKFTVNTTKEEFTALFNSEYGDDGVIDEMFEEISKEVMDNTIKVDEFTELDDGEDAVRILIKKDGKIKYYLMAMDNELDFRKSDYDFMLKDLGLTPIIDSYYDMAYINIIIQNYFINHQEEDYFKHNVFISRDDD